MNKKFLAIITVVITLFVLFNTTVAADTASDTVSTESCNDAYTEFMRKVGVYAPTGYNCYVAYTPDSVAFKGITTGVYVDVDKLETGFVIQAQLPNDVEIYDDPNTTVIDGIVVNGECINSYRIPVDLDVPQYNIIEVKLVHRKVSDFEEEKEDTAPSVDTNVSDEAYDVFVSKLEKYTSTGFSNRIVYTVESVRNKGVTLNPYTDYVKFETGFTITPCLDLGISIYDDPSTDIIEGIRVNGSTVTSYTVPIDLDNLQNYTVEIRLVYSEGVLGTLAKISDGNFNWNTLIEEPLLLMQGLYYILAVISVLAGSFTMLISKRKRVKTSDEIASKVDERVHEGCETLSVAYASVLQDNLLPLLNTVVETNQAVIKAVTLSTSKSKEAPVALLDVLKNVSDVNIEQDIEHARQEVLKNIEDTDIKRAAIREALSHIANGTYQEVHREDGTQHIPKPTAESSDLSDSSETSETKSVF